MEPGAVAPQFVKPRFRGRLHQLTFCLTVPATVLTGHDFKSVLYIVAFTLFITGLRMLPTNGAG